MSRPPFCGTKINFIQALETCCACHPMYSMGWTRQPTGWPVEVFCDAEVWKLAGVSAGCRSIAARLQWNKLLLIRGQPLAPSLFPIQTGSLEFRLENKQASAHFPAIPAAPHNTINPP